MGIWDTSPASQILAVFFFFSFWYLSYYYGLNLPRCIQPPLPLPLAIATIIGTRDISSPWYVFYFYFILIYFFLLYYCSFSLLRHIRPPPLPPSKTTTATGTRDVTMHLRSFGMFSFSFSLIHFFSFYYSFNLPWCIWLQLPPPSKTTGLKTQCVSSARYDFFFFCYFTMLMSFKSSPLLRMETTGVVGGGVKSSRCVTIRLELVP